MFSLETVIDVVLSILTVIPNTMGLAFCIMTLAILFGSIIAAVRANKVPVLGRLAALYVSFMRGTPLLVLLYIIYYSLPDIISKIWSVDPNNISPVFSVIISFSLYLAAFQSENIRGALNSVEYGQMEAGYSIGMTTFQVYSRIIVPQALRIAIINFCNGYVSAIKALSLAFTVSVVDILAKAKLCSALNFRQIESYVAAALVYWALCTSLTRLFSRFERALKRGGSEVTVESNSI